MSEYIETITLLVAGLKQENEKLKELLRAVLNSKHAVSVVRTDGTKEYTSNLFHEINEVLK